MDLKITGRKIVDWIHVSQDTVRWRDYVNKALGIHLKLQNVLPKYATILTSKEAPCGGGVLDPRREIGCIREVQLGAGEGVQCDYEIQHLTHLLIVFKCMYTVCK
jgi:hypothetical protein